MAAPRVFVSSTCYDLGPYRMDIERMIRSLGWEPVLSELGAVYYDPEKQVAEAAVEDVRHSNMFILIIGGRFGSEYKDSSKSITNLEYERAVELKLPIFALVLDSVEQELRTFEANMGNDSIDPSLIRYAAVDSPKI